MSPTRGLCAAALLALAIGAWVRMRWPSSDSFLDCPPGAISWVDAGGQLLARCGVEQKKTADPGPLRVPAPLRLAVGERIDLNRASEQELASVPGIGPHLAKALVDTRKSRGHFGTWQQVDEVKGVGPAKLRILQRTTSIAP